MATFTLRTALRPTLITLTGTTIACQSYKHYTTRTAHADSPPLPKPTKPTSTPTPKTLTWSGFTELKLHSSEMVNHNVKKLTFILPTEDTITGLSPVTSLLTQHTPEGSWIPVFRPYTPISSGTEPGTLTFLIKKYPNGKGSGKMHDLLPGEGMKFKPLHEFDYKPNEFESVLCIAGGSGITPIYQLTKAILGNAEDKTSIVLVYANNSQEDVLLRKEFEELERKYPERFRKVFTVSKGGEGEVETGYVTRDTIAKVWPGKREGQKVLVSGPPAMTESVAGAKGGFGWTQGSVGGILKELGYGKEDVHKF